MAYSELIKKFAGIRDYISQFYVYGFKSRREYNIKSMRSYDNERRRIESWLGDYMRFERDSDGKNVFLSVDSRAVSQNPLYKAFKAKSFTSKDIMLHFYILDILHDGAAMSAGEIADKITSDYFSMFEDAAECDESTVRKKINEYEKLGLLESEKQSKKKLYRLSADSVNIEGFKDAVGFFSEVDPIGLVGSYISDRYDKATDQFSFKHHYIFNALESEVLYALLEAIKDSRAVEIELLSERKNGTSVNTVFPMKVYVSTYNGRRYIMSWNYRLKDVVFYRLDKIREVKLLNEEKAAEKYREYAAAMVKKLWGVSYVSNKIPDRIEMVLRIEDGAEYILNRLEREKRCGKVERLENGDYKFTAEVNDSMELLPWIRTFTGRIVSISCSNKQTEKVLHEDLEAMNRMYEVNDDIQ
jgi:hypothetical protein